MITLYKYGPASGLPDLSPFCIKVETYLRLAGVPFQPKLGDPRKAPKKKLPFIADGNALIPDSRDIIAYLESKAERPLGMGETPEQRAIAVAFRGLLEEELYFSVLYLRWVVDFPNLMQPVLVAYLKGSGAPGPIASLLARVIRRDVVRTCWSQGVGRHTEEQVYGRLGEVVEALSAQLGDKPFFLGERPSVIDATVFAFTLFAVEGAIGSRAQSYARVHPNLVAYCDRIRTQYFAEPAVGRAVSYERAQSAVHGS